MSTRDVIAEAKQLAFRAECNAMSSPIEMPSQRMVDAGIDAFLAALAAAGYATYDTRTHAAVQREPRRWRHAKRGTVYQEIGRAELQIATLDVVEGSTLVIYQGDDGALWARQEDEFEDGRFVEIAAEAEAKEASAEQTSLTVPQQRTLDKALWRSVKFVGGAEVEAKEAGDE